LATDASSKKKRIGNSFRSTYNDVCVTSLKLWFEKLFRYLLIFYKLDYVPSYFFLQLCRPVSTNRGEFLRSNLAKLSCLNIVVKNKIIEELLASEDKWKDSADQELLVVLEDFTQDYHFISMVSKYNFSESLLDSMNENPLIEHFTSSILYISLLHQN